MEWICERGQVEDLERVEGAETVFGMYYIFIFFKIRTITEKLLNQDNNFHAILCLDTFITQSKSIEFTKIYTTT